MVMYAKSNRIVFPSTLKLKLFLFIGSSPPRYSASHACRSILTLYRLYFPFSRKEYIPAALFSDTTLSEEYPPHTIATFFFIVFIRNLFLSAIYCFSPYALIVTSIPSPLFNYSLYISRDIAFEIELFSCLWMHEPQCFCMQALPRAERKAVINELLVLGKVGASQNFVAPVALIVKERVSDILHMHPYLVCTAGFELALHERYIAKSFQHLVVSNRGFTLFSPGEYTHQHAIPGIASDIAFYSSFIGCHVAPHECRVEPFRLFSEKLPGKVCFGFRCLGHEQQARRLFVYPVDQPHTGVIYFCRTAKVKMVSKGIH